MGEIINAPYEVNKEKVEAFLPKLDSLIIKYPEYQYPPYFKAKLLMVLGSDQNALSAFLPFAKQKRNDFWVWELMSKIQSHDKDIQFSCYCKALSLKAQEDFLVKLRTSFAELLIEREMYSEAKAEIEKVVATRSSHDWKTPNKVVQWMESSWYKTTEANADNSKLYRDNLGPAEQILFEDVPEEVIAVEFVNRDKKILNFIKDKTKHGFFNYSGYLKSPQIGDTLKVRFADNSQGDFHKALTCEMAEPETASSVIKDFSGEARVIEASGIAFVDDVFIAPQIVASNKLQSEQNITGKAILSYNKKKGEWGWKAFNIESL